MPKSRRGIGILSERFGIAFSEDFDHPMMEVIDGMILNRAETTVIFLSGLVQVTA